MNLRPLIQVYKPRTEHGHMVVGRRDVDMPWFDGMTVLPILDLKRRPPPRMSASNRGLSGDVWSTMSTEALNSSGNPPSSSTRAATPPHDAPTTIILRADVVMPRQLTGTEERTLCMCDGLKFK